MELDIKHEATDGPLHPLYCKYSMQTNPQDAYVELDCGKCVLLASWNAEISNAIPMDVWHGHSIRFTVSHDLTTTEINDLLDEISHLARHVIAGYTSEWDGSNHKAHYTDDAETVLDEIHELCSTAATASYGVVFAGDWLGDFGPSDYGITAKTTDEELEAIAAQIEAEGLTDSMTIDGVMELATDWRDDLRTEAQEAASVP